MKAAENRQPYCASRVEIWNQNGRRTWYVLKTGSIVPFITSYVSAKILRGETLDYKLAQNGWYG